LYNVAGAAGEQTKEGSKLRKQLASAFALGADIVGSLSRKHEFSNFFDKKNATNKENVT